MKRAIVVIVLVVAAMSCLVSRKSSDFECDTTTDCEDPSRECKEGFCVVATCPAICDSCGAGKTCTINCTTAQECRTGVTCPSGYACTFNCSQDCTPVVCVSAASCEVNCTGMAASCGPLTCGVASPCTCTGTGCI